MLMIYASLKFSASQLLGIFVYRHHCFMFSEKRIYINLIYHKDSRVFWFMTFRPEWYLWHNPTGNPSSGQPQRNSNSQSRNHFLFFIAWVFYFGGTRRYCEFLGHSKTSVLHRKKINFNNNDDEKKNYHRHQN